MLESVDQVAMYLAGTQLRYRKTILWMIHPVHQGSIIHRRKYKSYPDGECLSERPRIHRTLEFNALEFNALEFNALEFNALEFNALEFTCSKRKVTDVCQTRLIIEHQPNYLDFQLILTDGSKL